jgi:hypothetical protein
MNTKSTAQVN